MVLDELKNWKNYQWASDRFVRAFEYLATLAADAPEGRVELDGENLFCMVQGYETKPLVGQKFEAHRDYADIQMVLEGKESILWAPTGTLTTTEAYKPDIEFFALTPAPTDVVLKPFQFCVLYPQDAHAPCTAVGAPARVRKVVVKVKLG